MRHRDLGHRALRLSSRTRASHPAWRQSSVTLYFMSSVAGDLDGAYALDAAWPAGLPYLAAGFWVAAAGFCVARRGLAVTAVNKRR